MLPSKTTLISLAFMFLWGMTSVAHPQVYRCEVNGQTVFSQAPCAPDAETVNVRPAPSGQVAPSGGIRPGERQMLQSHEDRQQRQRERAEEARAAAEASRRLEEAVRNRQVMTGMNPDQVRRAWGSPAEVIHGIDSNGRWERWEYIRGSRRQYVRFRNGEVTGVSTI